MKKYFITFILLLNISNSASAIGYVEDRIALGATGMAFTAAMAAGYAWFFDVGDLPAKSEHQKVVKHLKRKSPKFAAFSAWSKEVAMGAALTGVLLCSRYMTKTGIGFIDRRLGL